MKIQHREKLDSQFRHLSQGKRYSVQKGFSDYDGVAHLVGEVWEFIGSNFVPYHDGLSLFAKINGEEQQIRFQWSPEEQASVIEELDEYLMPCE